MQKRATYPVIPDCSGRGFARTDIPESIIADFVSGKQTRGGNLAPPPRALECLPNGNELGTQHCSRCSAWSCRRSTGGSEYQAPNCQHTLTAPQRGQSVGVTGDQVRN